MKHETLPDDPKGWTKLMGMHLNFGSKGGAATYSVHDPDGDATPIGYQYDTRKDGYTGFTVVGVNDPDGQIRMFPRWSDLVAFWPEYAATSAAQEQGKGESSTSTNLNRSTT